MSTYYLKNYTQEVRVILPQGMQSLMSENAGETATLCMYFDGAYCGYKYRALIRAFVTKMPGTSFSGFKEKAMLSPQVIISEP